MTYNAFEENEISINAKGGTELIKRRVAAAVPEAVQQHFQVICSRVRKLHEDKIRIYWVHDLPGDGETNHLHNIASRDRFHKIVFCGYWQYQQYLDHLRIEPDAKLCVIDNAIEPIERTAKVFETIDLVYCSTPQRGLALLVPVFIALAKENPALRLHVFSSFKIYGFEDREEDKKLFEACEAHPQIIYHGVQPNEKVREVMARSHIFAYPSIWPECNSISLIEAMSAGLLCVHPNFAGLMDTSGGLTAQYQMTNSPQDHIAMFYQTLKYAIEQVDSDNVQNHLTFVKAYADSRFSMKRAVAIWNDHMEGLLATYPSEESRKLPTGPTFSYRAL